MSTAEGDHAHCLTCIKPGRCKSKLQLACPIVDCPYKPGCPASFHACKSAEHEEFTCSEALVPCLNRHYGCEKVLARRKIPSHLPRCPASVVHCSFKWVRKLVSPMASNSALDSEDSGLDSPSTPSPLNLTGCVAALKVSIDPEELINWRPVSPVTINVRCKLCKPRSVVVREPQLPCPAHYSGRAWANSRPTNSNGHTNEISVHDFSASRLRTDKRTLCSKKMKEHRDATYSADYLDLALLRRDERRFSARTFSASPNTCNFDFDTTDHTSINGDPLAQNSVDEFLNDQVDLSNEYNLLGLTGNNTSGENSGPGSSRESSVTSSEDNARYARPSSALSSYFDYLLAQGGTNSNLRREKLNRRPLSFPPARTNHRGDPNNFGVESRRFSSSCMLIPDSVLDRILSNQQTPPSFTGHQRASVDPLNTTRLQSYSSDFSNTASLSSSNDLSCRDLSGRVTPFYEPRIHSYARYLLKPRSIHYFTCSQFVRRDAFADHHRNCHAEIQGNVDEWLLHHCPLRERGCSFRVQRFVPVSSPHLSRDLMPPKIHRKAPIFTTGDMLYNLSTDGLNFKPHLPEILYVSGQPDTAHITSLPFETLCAVAQCLDPFSLYNLSLVNRQFLSVARKLLPTKGVVLTVWGRVASTLVPTLRPNLFTVDSEGIRRDQVPNGGPGRASLIRKTRWEIVDKKWIYPKSFSSVDEWNLHGNSSAAIAEHLRTCIYNERNEQTKPFAYIYPVPDLPDDKSFPRKAGLFKIEASITIGRVCP